MPATNVKEPGVSPKEASRIIKKLLPSKPPSSSIRRSPLGNLLNTSVNQSTLRSRLADLSRTMHTDVSDTSPPPMPRRPPREYALDETLRLVDTMRQRTTRGANASFLEARAGAPIMPLSHESDMSPTAIEAESFGPSMIELQDPESPVFRSRHEHTVHTPLNHLSRSLRDLSMGEKMDVTASFDKEMERRKESVRHELEAKQKELLEVMASPRNKPDEDQVVVLQSLEIVASSVNSLAELIKKKEVEIQAQKFKYSDQRRTLIERRRELLEQEMKIKQLEYLRSLEEENKSLAKKTESVMSVSVSLEEKIRSQSQIIYDLQKSAIEPESPRIPVRQAAEVYEIATPQTVNVAATESPLIADREIEIPEDLPLLVETSPEIFSESPPAPPDAPLRGASLMFDNVSPVSCIQFSPPEDSMMNTLLPSPGIPMPVSDDITVMSPEFEAASERKLVLVDLLAANQQEPWIMPVASPGDLSPHKPEFEVEVVGVAPLAEEDRMSAVGDVLVDLSRGSVESVSLEEVEEEEKPIKFVVPESAMDLLSEALVNALVDSVISEQFIELSRLSTSSTDVPSTPSNLFVPKQPLPVRVDAFDLFHTVAASITVAAVYDPVAVINLIRREVAGHLNIKSDDPITDHLVEKIKYMAIERKLRSEFNDLPDSMALCIQETFFMLLDSLPPAAYADRTWSARSRGCRNPLSSFLPKQHSVESVLKQLEDLLVESVAPCSDPTDRVEAISSDFLKKFSLDEVAFQLGALGVTTVVRSEEEMVAAEKAIVAEVAGFILEAVVTSVATDFDSPVHAF